MEKLDEVKTASQLEITRKLKEELIKDMTKSSPSLKNSR
jgi:hypothetical protein